MFEQAFKNIDDVLHKDAGSSSELDYTEQTSWLLFLKYLDALEQDKAMEAELHGRAYDFIVAEPFRWATWAAPRTADGKIDYNHALTVTYMGKAGLLSRPARGRIAITDAGKAALASKPVKIDIPFLLKYPSFVAFRTKAKPPFPGDSQAHESATSDQRNPEELLYLTYDALRQSIEADMLDRLQAPEYPWEAFERLVVELLGAMGYGSSTDETTLRVTKLTGDEGIDGVIDEDKLGLDAVYIQAKKYQAKTGVGRPSLQAFAGSLEGQRASKGVFLTTSYFTGEAEEYVRRISRRIVLVDGRALTRLMYDYGIGVRLGRSLAIKRVDDAYFEGEV
ncbi:MAG TPA: restriction endonuclease [Candidatus Limnocylindrales bacterium]